MDLTMEENNVEAVEQPAVENTEAPLQEVETPTTETVETPVAEEPQTQEELAYYQKQQVQTPNFETDDGFIDPAKFYNQVKADALKELREELRFEATEKKVWGKIEEKHPELKTDAELRDLLNAQRIADVAQGGNGDLNRISDKFFGKLNSYKIQGKAQAQVSEKIQKSASLSTQTNNTVQTNANNDLMDRMSRGDQVAKEQLIEQWLADGKL